MARDDAGRSSALLGPVLGSHGLNRSQVWFSCYSVGWRTMQTTRCTDETERGGHQLTLITRPAEIAHDPETRPVTGSGGLARQLHSCYTVTLVVEHRVFCRRLTLDVAICETELVPTLEHARPELELMIDGRVNLLDEDAQETIAGSHCQHASARQEAGEERGGQPCCGSYLYSFSVPVQNNKRSGSPF